MTPASWFNGWAAKAALKAQAAGAPTRPKRHRRYGRQSLSPKHRGHSSKRQQRYGDNVQSVEGGGGQCGASERGSVMQSSDGFFSGSFGIGGEGGDRGIRKVVNVK